MVNGSGVSRITDVSIRRLRIGVQGQLTPRVYVYGLFGGNNYNFTSKAKDKIGILDLYADYQFAQSSPSVWVSLAGMVAVMP